MNFEKNFFDSYVVGESQYCAVNVKACLAVFRSVATIDSCTVRLDRDEQRLVFVLKCADVKKEFKIPLEEAQRRNVDVAGDRPHHFVATPKQLSEYLSNFHTSIPEITISASRDKLSLQSFLNGQINQAEGVRALYTQMELPTTVFSEYFVKNDDAIALTVSLREFKAFILFCENILRPIKIQFVKTGAPVLVSVSGNAGFTATMLLATVHGQNDDPNAQVTESHTAETKIKAQPNKDKKSVKLQKELKPNVQQTTNNDDSEYYYSSYDASNVNEQQQQQQQLNANEQAMTTTVQAQETTNDNDMQLEQANFNDEDDDQVFPTSGNASPVPNNRLAQFD